VFANLQVVVILNLVLIILVTGGGALA